MSKVLRFFLILFTVVTPALAQTAELSGRVADSSDAVIMNAAVQATNVATGVSSRTMTTTAGYYTVPDLAPGVYNITVSAKGFQTQTKTGVALAVEQSARLDFTMLVGAATTSVTVLSNEIFLNTEDSTLGTVTGNEQILGLPLVGRQFLQFAQLGPGVNSGRPGTVQASQQGIAISSNGLYANDNNYILDGADNNESYQNQFVVAPSVDAVAEFKTQTGLYPAEYGRGGGAVVSVVTKSGTNQFHGVAFEFVQNNIFNAENFFAQAANPPLHRNQFGGSLGGPIRRNRTFFFINYDGTDQAAELPHSSVVPTQAERGGDLSAIGKIVDPYNGGTPFAGNVIPANRISTVSTNLLAYWPLPNQPAGSTYNYYISLPSTTTVENGIAKVDHTFSDSDKVFVRYGNNNSTSFTSGPVPLVGGSTATGGGNGAVANWTHIFSPTRLTISSVSYNRFIQNAVGQNHGTALASQAGITGISTTPDQIGFVEAISFSTGTGFVGLGENTPMIRYMNTLQAENNTSISLRSHSLAFGGEYRDEQANIMQTSGVEGDFTFNGQYSGNGFSDFLLGAPSSTTTTLGAEKVHPRRKSMALFLQDDWKVTSRLTVNMGLRWEYNTPVKDASNKLSAFDHTTGAVVFVKDANLGNFYTTIRPDLTYERLNTDTLYSSYYHDFGPRLGVSWQPFGSKTVFRAGGGLFYLSPLLNAVQNTGNTPPFQIQVAGTGNATGTPNLSWALSTTPAPGVQYGIFTFHEGQKFIDGRIMEWMAQVQHDLGHQWVAKAAYVGDRGNHLDQQLSTNDLPPGPGAASTRRIFNQWGRIRSFETYGWSSYHGLQASLEKQFTNGFAVFAGYTFSKTMDFGSMGDICCEQDQNTLAAERGLSGQDQKHHFGANAIYALPIGRGHWLGGSSNAVVNGFIGGWNLSTVMTFASGFPANPTISSNRDNVPDNTDRPNRVGNGNISNHTITKWWDVTAFAVQPLYTYGNSGRNVLIGPGTSVANLGLSKAETFHESDRLEFRWEMSNFTNTPNWGVPTTDIANPNFGKVSSASSPRQMQFGLKFYF